MTAKKEIYDVLDCIEARLTTLCMYSERQTIALERLVEMSEVKKKREPVKRSRFTPPTIEEVSDYIKKNKAGIDANAFVDYYEARGWKLNNGETVKSWEACVRTWSRNGFNNAPKQSNDNTGAVL